MLTPIDTRILTARPKHLTELTAEDRAAEEMLAHRRATWIARLVGAIVRRINTRVSSRA